MRLTFARSIKQVLVQRARTTHALAHRNLDAAGKEQLGNFDAGSVDLSSVTAGALYLGGWNIASRPEILMFEQEKVRNQLTIRVFYIIFLCNFAS